MLGSLITAPVRLGIRGASLVVHEALALPERLLGLLGIRGDEAERFNGQAPAPQPRPSSPPASASAALMPPTRLSARSRPPPPAPAAEPARTEPLETEPVHVSESPELVAEVAERGAENGAGAQIHIAEPWEGYRAMKAADIIERLSTASREELAAVELYEISARGRKSVVAAARRTLEQASRPR